MSQINSDSSDFFFIHIYVFLFGYLGSSVLAATVEMLKNVLSLVLFDSPDIDRFVFSMILLMHLQA